MVACRFDDMMYVVLSLLAVVAFSTLLAVGFVWFRRPIWIVKSLIWLDFISLLSRRPTKRTKGFYAMSMSFCLSVRSFVRLSVAHRSAVLSKTDQFRAMVRPGSTGGGGGLI